MTTMWEIRAKGYTAGALIIWDKDDMGVSREEVAVSWVQQPKEGVSTGRVHIRLQRNGRAKGGRKF